MQNLDKTFGLVIAFMLPGFICLVGLSQSFPWLDTWLLANSAESAPALGGFLYATLASLALGILVSAVRWLLLDSLLHFTGLERTELDFSKLADTNKVAMFVGIVENHYRYYQYYSNSLVAILIALCAHVIYSDDSIRIATWCVLITIVFILFLGSRDCLKKYYARTKSLIDSSASVMKN